jgi:hypothetical protein
MLVRARAALLGGVQLHVVHNFNERRNGGASAGGTAGRRGDGDGSLNVGRAARAALALFELASGLLALQFALGLGAVGGLEALVLADEFLANRAALGFGGSASGVAASRLADGLALGAVFLLALVLGAADGADGLFAMDGALGARHFLTLHLAFGAFTDGVADRGASRVVALPFAGRVTLF